MADVRHHLAQLGLHAETVLAALPDHLTLSILDGVLFVCEQAASSIKVHVDFVHGPMAYRASGHIGGEHLVKACKLKSAPTCHILDATCGMGRDSFLLYKAGCKVSATEQNPVVHALLADGLSRYQRHVNESAFELHQADATKLMHTQSYDVIYLDPMFPEKLKSAKTKKDMQLFHQLHQHAVDNAHQLLTAALKTDCKRVVIKRPIHAKPLISRKPTFQIVGKTCRFEAFQLK